ncbi:MAG: hypothetical protein ACD_62C00312G0001 [uncultured bacterium]|nr:MAG: hypothetical protein ACD_62C00312G0001 [uncultured bacterium]HLD45593.1 ArsR family transcriptional regulator [bacterium]
MQMLDAIITSKSRVKVLLKFFLNPGVKAYLREMSTEFGDSTNSVRVELNRLVEAKLLKIQKDGRNIYYSANMEHPLYPEINTIFRKVTGVDKIYEWISSIGNLEQAYITGDYAKGIDGGIIDIILVGDIDKKSVFEMVERTEQFIGRKIRPLLLSQQEFVNMNGKLANQRLLKLWG